MSTLNQQHDASVFDENYYSTDAYDNYIKTYTQQGIDIATNLISHLPTQKNWKFIDVGCGMGGLVYGLHYLGYSAVGTEVSEYCLLNSSVKEFLIYADAQKLPFEDKLFDVSISAEVLYYFKPELQRSALLELKRVTKKFIYFDTIAFDSKNADQDYNPDEFRNQKYLLTYQENKELCQSIGLEFVCSLYPKKTEGDFEGIFKVI